MLRTVVYLFVLVCVVVQGFTVAQRIVQRAQQQVAALDAVQRQLEHQLVQQISQQQQPAQPAQSQLTDLGLPQ